MISLMNETDPKLDMGPPKPLYKQVKDYVIGKIMSNEWPPHYQIPSEHTFVRNMQISRMTIHRALRELTQDGYLERIQGVGTFVAEAKSKTPAVDIKDIDVLIQERGNAYKCDVHFLQSEPIGNDYAKSLNLNEGDTIFRAYLVHRENGVPLVLEDRYVNPELAPDYLKNDFKRRGSDSYFRAHFSLLSHEHKLEAVMSTPEAHHFLELEQPTPCIQVNRRTWTGNQILSSARFLYPGHRHHMTW
ncbi:MAG: UTRA domain-containing protein [Sneathiellales bacterium]|nr:UTRA domain-containing protein [Sneathiellales bacterium]